MICINCLNDYPPLALTEHGNLNVGCIEIDAGPLCRDCATGIAAAFARRGRELLVESTRQPPSPEPGPRLA